MVPVKGRVNEIERLKERRISFNIEIDDTIRANENGLLEQRKLLEDFEIKYNTWSISTIEERKAEYNRIFHSTTPNSGHLNTPVSTRLISEKVPSPQVLPEVSKCFGFIHPPIQSTLKTPEGKPRPTGGTKPAVVADRPVGVDEDNTKSAQEHEGAACQMAVDIAKAQGVAEETSASRPPNSAHLMVGNQSKHQPDHQVNQQISIASQTTAPEPNMQHNTSRPLDHLQ
ncbi:hypothetical protein FoTM2_017743 [Fusarium oxysporum f. sp. vasinfectum]|nr:hypothetical protein FoTM2_017743 [Fusarium oxysporum f. sp. vasinfectum]